MKTLPNPPLFKLESPFAPAGDQPEAIKTLVGGVQSSVPDQVLLGVTGSGKTFTMAQVIAQTNRPALIMAHNKTLAAQLYEEFKSFFPHNAVEYFVSYYDYYQPEAYVPRSDTYIEKTAEVNEQIDRMRHSATRALFERQDVIIIASVSCIYGIGDPESYSQMVIPLAVGDTVERDALLAQLVSLQYSRNETAFFRGTFRTKGDVVDVFPSHLEDMAWRIQFFDDEVEEIVAFDPLTGQRHSPLEKVTIYANSHYVVPKPAIQTAIGRIQAELKERLAELESQQKLVEAQRLRERVRFDLEMLATVGYCNGIENYSRHLTGRAPGEPPPTLFDYLPQDALVFVDESHVSIGQIGGMYRGDNVRKTTLVDYGFRLPSAVDNRPLKFEEWDVRRGQTIYVSATPKDYELALAGPHVAEQVVRPTGLIDPEITLKPVAGQVDDLMAEVQKTTAVGHRTLVTTLTKKMAEQLTDYLHEHGVRVRYLHSEIDTLERAEIIRDLRLGAFDVLVGINLLREGLDIPEVGLVAILDADKEGFLRSATSLIQTVGRAARNVEGRAILYADVMTKSIQITLDECARRREKQVSFNQEHGVVPKSTSRKVGNSLGGEGFAQAHKNNQAGVSPAATEAEHRSEHVVMDEIKALRREMKKAASGLEFETAAALRDRIKTLEEIHLKS